jgi:hemolysin III
MQETTADAEELPHVPLVDEAAEQVHVEPKPTWRGWIHAGITPVAVVAGIVLVVLANGIEAKWASAVFALTSVLLFGNSALYHRIDWSAKVKRTLKRVDHANIFLLIAGTYTPMALLALPGAAGIRLLSIVWGVAVVGIAFRVFWIGAPRWLYVLIYIGLGWAALMDFGALFAANTTMMVLFLIGGLLYTGGAVAYGLKRPNPFPGRFGFHEIFHTCTVLAFLCHWSATLVIALHPVALG